MSKPDNLGGIIHTYQKYDSVQFPSPTTPPSDLVSPAVKHLKGTKTCRRPHQDRRVTAGFASVRKSVADIFDL